MIVTNALVQLIADHNHQVLIGEGELRLFVNDYTPDRLATLANFTQATFPGYAPIPSSYLDWSTPQLNPDGGYFMTRDNAVFEYNAMAGPTSEIVYGYYVVNISAMVVVLCERFPNPVTVIDPTKIVLTLEYMDIYNYCD